jgi:glyoxylase-like metal-dependent hydrolase (beta-lactamase superfamily II)
MAGMTARLDVLCDGYAADRVASTVVLIRDEGAVIVVDPGMVADRTHLWWSQQGPQVDPLAEDQDLLERSRARLLALTPSLIVPGHGAPFRPPAPPG